MTLQEALDAVAQQPVAVLLVLAGMVAAAYLIGKLHGPGAGAERPWRYAYSVLVYAACVPGVLASLLTLYTVLFLRESLLRVDVLVYFAPIVTMVATVAIIHRNVDLAGVPGFDRLSGLVTLLALSFAIVFALSRLFVGLIFFGSIASLAAITVFVFAVLKWGTTAAFRRRGTAAPRPPSLKWR